MKFFDARLKSSAAAFSLVEVALALGVASFCLITVIGLIPVGVNTGQIASDQTIASSILTEVMTDLRATPRTSPPGGAATSTEYAVPIPANTAGGAPAPTVLYFGDTTRQFSFSPTSGSSRYRLTINFLPSAGNRRATGVSLLVSWPPAVDPTAANGPTPTGRVQVFAALDRN